MASGLDVLFCALAATVLWPGVGFALARQILPGALALPLAPVLGWAVHSAVALPLHMLAGMSRVVVVTQIVASLAVAFICWLRSGLRGDTPSPAVPLWAYAAAGVLALGVAAAVLPKTTADGVALAGPIFDHSKIAMIDEMARLGVPPGNPFFTDTASPTRLSYYYLWHFSAAELAVLTGASGWEADAGLTWFTAFSSLSLMMGFAVWFAGRQSAAAWVVVLAATASMRTLLSLAVGPERFAQWIAGPSGFAGWLFQASWAPQHVMAAGCVVLAVFLLVQLAQRRDPLRVVTLALVVAAGYESSAWAGGVTFAIAATLVASVLLWRIPPRDRTAFLVCAAIAATLALILAAPFLYDQAVTTAMRGGGSPIAIWPFYVLGVAFPEPLHGVLNGPAFWLVHLTVEFPAFYPAGVIALVVFARRTDLPQAQKLAVAAFAALTLAGLVVAWLFASTIGNNNDLGWRAVLPAILMLIAFAAAGLSRWLVRPARLAPVAAIGAVLLGIPDGLLTIRSNVVAELAPSSKVFAASPAMWEAVRRHAGAADRIANNPLFLGEVTAWPVNISWALLANRRSCYAGAELAQPFAPVSAVRRDAIAALFVRTFEGNAGPDDVTQLASRFGCRVVVVTAQDGAWNNDPFAASAVYRLVESEPTWRIYKAAADPQ